MGEGEKSVWRSRALFSVVLTLTLMGPTRLLSATEVPSGSATAKKTVTELTQSEQKLPEKNVTLRPSAAFSHERRAWNRYRFSALAQNIGFEKPLVYRWEFGDGGTETKPIVDHTFQKPGDYRVRLSVSSADSKTVTQETVVSISFFHFSNWKFGALIALLGVVLLALVMVMGRLGDDEEGEEENA